MFMFIVGGVKGGKSMFAQHTVKYLRSIRNGELYYFATMLARDNEDEKRIARHISDRAGWGFKTIEEGYNINNSFNMLNKKSIVLFDSLTAYVQNNIFSENEQYSFDLERFSRDIDIMVKLTSDVVMVSDYIFSDAVRYEDMTNLFIEKLGKAHQIAAQKADIVVECAFSNMKIWKNTNNIDISSILTDYNNCDSHLKYNDI